MPHMKWPPKIVRTDMIGEVRDVNGRNIPRDIGRPVHIGGNTYYTFGDTFCFDDRGEFVGGTNNTVAFVPHPRKQPHICQYLEQQPHVSQYVPHTQGEANWEAEPQHKKDNDRVTCWPFGGIIEVSPGQGWTFFDKALTGPCAKNAPGGGHFGMGIARVSVKDGNRLHVERPMGENMIFGADEPRFGSITHIIDDDGYVYLLGGRDPNPPFGLYNHWARIKLQDDFTRRENYEFQVKGGAWKKDYGNVDNLKPINNMDIQAQGAVVKLPGLAPPGKPYMWFGVNKYMANHLYIGCAPHIDGPWEVEDGGEIPQDPAGHTGPRYALYPHNKSCEPFKGQMLISWSDAGQMGGKVNMAKFHFEKEDGSPPEPEEQYERLPPKKGNFGDGPQGGGQGGGHGGHDGQHDGGGHGIGSKLKGLFK